MILLQLNDVDKFYGADCVLSNVKLEVKSGDKIAIVGRNGSGKSTLLKIIAEKTSFENGEIYKPKDVSIGYLAQNTGLQSSHTIKEEMLLVFQHLLEMENKLRQLELKMAKISPTEQTILYEKTLEKYDKLQTKFKNQGGYTYEAEINAILNGLQFDSYDDSTTINSLSGGQKTRLALGKLLLMKPDILILDEPTNHLDIETLSWLEHYLKSYEGAVLIVSHDRYFLDEVVQLVFEISQQSLTKYNGNYTNYLQQKAADYERDLKRFEKQQSEIARMEDFIQRNIARASTTKRAQSRRRQLQRIERIERPHDDDKTATFSFTIERQSGNDVLKVNDLAVGYTDEPVAKSINFDINRGDSIALIGPNGIGKTTLLKTIANKLTPINGNLQIGTNVKIGYYDQEQAELNSNKTVLNELWDSFPFEDEEEIRTVLGRFLFSGDDVLKHIATLSGGEKARLALAKLFMKKANFLILDEPTNHLDLDSKEVLENALVEYPGTILFVSHDRYFINRIASKVIELHPDGITEYLGDYNYYIDKKTETEELEKLAIEEQTDKGNKRKITLSSYEEKKEEKRNERRRLRRIEQLEEMIESLEALVAKNEELLCKPNIFNDHEKVFEISNENEQLELELAKLIEEWGNLLDE